jgi:ketosteroid isomerase-like protein
MTLTPEVLIRKLFERVAADDNEGILELVDPGVVWLGTRGGLDAQRVVRGSEAFLGYIREIEQTWEQFDVELERVIASDDTGVAFLREIARGRDAIDLQNETAVVFRIQGGRIAEVRGYLDRGEALEAAGLRE